MGSLNLQSPAKINLYLRVLNKRPDGFHDLDSAFQLIDLFDNIEMSDIDSSEVIIQCEPSIIKSEDNIILKAINDLKKDYKIDNGIEIKLKKNIPIGAGLGGGSSNAASVLLGLNKMWGLDISYSEMVKRGKSLGADVPFFIHGENAYVSGIGDQFRSKKFNQEKYVLICPNISISTKEMFEYYSKGINLPLAENMDMQNSFLVSVLYKYPEINLFYKKNISSFDIH